MKTLNDYGQDVMDAQTRVEAIETSIQQAEAAMESLLKDRDEAGVALLACKKSLQEATERVLAGDYGADTLAAETAPEGVLVADGWVEQEETFEGLNQNPPDDDFTLHENRTLASNGAGF